MGLPLARFYYSHALFNRQRLLEAKTQLASYFADVEAAGPQRILNMPNGMLGRAVSDEERAASRFKVRASSPEAQADAHTMLALIAEREEGPAAAVPHFQQCAQLASSPRQKADAHKNLSKLYATLGDEEKQTEHEALASSLLEQAVAEEAEAARKKAATEKEGQDGSEEAAEVPEAEEAAEKPTLDGGDAGGEK
uniref:Uncharacterized protein n=1 Tax=Haptolina brevifila TaxID=156173 RepID=A0A7S2MAH4_9EUKA|mmetsp:Transcript_48210/g.96138  ORF Transcript_48210/g.96138 Transcript_48210/m.96138 type:complete len:195 (+) Transcript_48210:196-780(+)